jgi:ATP synthase protein I
MADDLEKFGTKLKNAQQELSTGNDQLGKNDDLTSDAERSSFQRAMRIGSDMIAGVVVGVVLGLAVDRAFDTKPWGFIIMFFLGSAAGMWNVFRAVTGQGYTVGFRHSGQKEKPPNVTVDDKDA